MSDILVALSHILSEESISPKDIYMRANKFEAQADAGGFSAKKENLKDSVKEDEDESEESESIEKLKDKTGVSDEEEEKSEKVRTPDESPSTIDLADGMNFDKLVDVLNQFRASRSLTDAEVNNELQKYFEKLTSEEKKVLHVFLKGLVQVTLIDVDGKAAYTPSDLKFDISKSGSATSEKIKSIKRKQKSKKAAKELSNSPIKIGESVQDKSEMLSILKSNV